MKIYHQSIHALKSQVFHAGYGIAAIGQAQAGFTSHFKNNKKLFTENVIEGLKVKKKQTTGIGYIQGNNNYPDANNSVHPYGGNSNYFTLLTLLVIPVLFIAKKISKRFKSSNIISIIFLILFCLNSLHSDTSSYIENIERSIRSSEGSYREYQSMFGRITELAGRPELDSYNRNTNALYRYKYYQYKYPLAATRIIAYTLLVPAALRYIYEKISNSYNPLLQINLSDIKKYVNFPLDDRYLPDYFSFAKNYYTHDGWGRKFIISKVFKKSEYSFGVTIKSSGADGKINSADDISISVYTNYYTSFYLISKLNQKSFLVFEPGGSFLNLLEFIFVKPLIQINEYWTPIIITSKNRILKNLEHDFKKNKLPGTKSDLILYVYK